MSLPWRKRLDHRLLRWQARFEGSAFDRSGPWMVATVFAVALMLLAMARSRELSQEDSLASAMQAVWLIGEGFKPDVSLLGHNYLFEQGGYLIYPVALLADVFPTALTLMIIQSVALALGVVPLWRLARGVAHLRIGATVAITVAYCVYSAIHALNVAGFHLEVLALPALIASVNAAYRDRWIRYGIYLLIVMLARADLGLAVSAMGGLWFLEGKRRLAYVTAAVGLAWTTLFVLVVQPAYGGGAFPHVDAFSEYGGDNPFEVLWGMVTSPVLFLRQLFSQENFSALVRLLAPVLFLPVVAPRYLLPAVPLYVLYLVADVPAGELAEAGQNVPVTAFVFVALVFALARTGRVVVQRVNVDRRVLGALLFTAGVFFVADSATSPYEEPWSWGRRDAIDLERELAAEMIPDDAVVRAAPKILPLVTERVGLFSLHLPEEAGDDSVASDAVADVNWLVLDLTEVPQWSRLDYLDFQSRVVVGQGFCLVTSQDAQIKVFTLPSEAERLGIEPELCGPRSEADGTA